MNYNYVNIIGLISDILGVWMLFIYGLPSKIKPHGGALLLDGEPDKVKSDREKANEHIKKMANLALFFITLGFVFQLTASIISASNYCTANNKPNCNSTNK